MITPSVKSRLNIQWFFFLSVVYSNNFNIKYDPLSGFILKCIEYAKNTIFEEKKSQAR